MLVRSMLVILFALVVPAAAAGAAIGPRTQTLFTRHATTLTRSAPLPAPRHSPLHRTTPPRPQATILDRKAPQRPESEILKRPAPNWPDTSPRYHQAPARPDNSLLKRQSPAAPPSSILSRKTPARAGRTILNKTPPATANNTLLNRTTTRPTDSLLPPPPVDPVQELPRPRPNPQELLAKKSAKNRVENALTRPAPQPAR